MNKKSDGPTTRVDPRDDIMRDLSSRAERLKGRRIEYFYVNPADGIVLGLDDGTEFIIALRLDFAFRDQ